MLSLWENCADVHCSLTRYRSMLLPSPNNRLPSVLGDLRVGHQGHRIEKHEVEGGYGHTL